MKHNKKRNTAFLYESLVKELTKAILRTDDSEKSIITSILKEHFSKGSVLQNQLSLYKTICEVSNVREETAEKILAEVKRVYHSFSEQDIFDEQTEVIKKINSNLSRKVFNNFISNYKTLATITQMFDTKTPISKRVILEEKIVELMTSSAESAPVLRPIDNITYRVFVNKFNEKYGTSLNESQKLLLSRYVTLSPETSLEFKLYINEEIGRLSKIIKQFQAAKEVALDQDLASKNKEILLVLEGFNNEELNDNMIKKILKIQALAAEV